MSGLSISGADLYAGGGMTAGRSAAPARSARTSGQEAPPAPEEESPSIAEMMLEAKEQAEKRREQLQLPRNSRYGDAAMEAYARLARARNAAQVTSAAGYARRRIIQLKAAMRQDSDHARQIQAVINQLQKAVRRCGKKKIELERERLTEKRGEKLEQERQRRKALSLRQQLARRRTMRAFRESGYLREAEVGNRLQAQLTATELELRQQVQELTEHFAPAQDAAIRQYAAQAPAEGAAPAPEIDVQA